VALAIRIDCSEISIYFDKPHSGFRRDSGMRSANRTVSTTGDAAVNETLQSSFIPKGQ
jgi:hypothetical protein